MARNAETYRGARRNACIRFRGQKWTPDWYYKEHRNRPQWALDKGLDTANDRPIYVPALAATRKTSSRINAIYEATRRGDYAGAVRAFFGAKRTQRRATGLGGG